MFRVLVVDDDPDLRFSVTAALSQNHYTVDQAADGDEAINRVKASKYDLVLLDVNMPKVSGIEALKEIKNHDASIIVIILTAFSNVSDAVTATKEGAYNYLEKPIRADNLVYMIDKALKAHKMVSDIRYSAPEIRLPNETEFVGQSSEMKKVFSVIEKLSRVDTAVLIRGESGTGKELVAKALHFNGPRKENRFVTINCSAIPETLIESEFFGHEKGAFTGADSRKIGKFQYADGGTLFLDEIGDVSAAMQVKLLRALQEKKFTPVGSNREIEVNVRIVAATNRNLEEMIKTGDFREDLFYRLNVLPIHLPSLKERKNDIPLLVSYFIEKFNEDYGKSVGAATQEVMSLLTSYNWPGNIRELENVIEHAFVMENAQELTINSLPELLIQKKAQFDQNPDQVTEFGAAGSEPIKPVDSVTRAVQIETGGEPLAAPADATIEIKDGAVASNASSGRGFRLDIQKLDYQANKEEFERQFLINALIAFNGRINQTALHANIPKKTLLRKLEKYGINARDYIRS